MSQYRATTGRVFSGSCGYPAPSMAHFLHDGQRLAYTVYGAGSRTTVLMPGLLLSQKMQSRLARELAAAENCVVTFDPLGHGDSDRPRDMWRYSMSAFAKQADRKSTRLNSSHLGISY